MQKIFSLILDFLFPPAAESIRLHALSPEEVLETLPQAEPAPLPFISSLFSYKDPLVKELVLSIKNKKDAHAVRCAAFALSKNIPINATLVPIPISKRRRNERGYNQCELIINEMIQMDEKLQKNFNILERVRDRGEQKLKDRAERLESTDIFQAQFIGDIPLIIVDDVCTTGSTLKEAREALLRAGYTNIKALTLAH